MALEYAHENIWYDKWRYDEAECQYYEKQYGGSTSLTTLASQIAKAREEIQSSLASGNRVGGCPSAPVTTECSHNCCRTLYQQLIERIREVEQNVKHIESEVQVIGKAIPGLKVAPAPVKAAGTHVPAPAPARTPPKKEAEEDDDDDVDLFGSDDEEEDEAAAKVREERLKAYADKKSKKPGPIAKSSVLLDCKPWDDETDMKVMEEIVRKIEMDGLVWGAGKLVPLAFGIMKLSILCIVEDEKVSIDDLIEKILENEDYVQSVDIAAFNKI